MQQIECARTECGQATYLIDNELTLDKGWWKGAEPSGMPFYVCPGHPAAYFIAPMPSAVIVRQEEAEPEAEEAPVEPAISECDCQPDPGPALDESAADDSQPGL